MQYTENADCGGATRKYCEENRCPYLRYNSMTDYPVCTKNYPKAKKEVDFMELVRDYMEECGADCLVDINGVLTPCCFNND